MAQCTQRQQPTTKFCNVSSSSSFHNFRWSFYFVFCYISQRTMHKILLTFWQGPQADEVVLTSISMGHALDICNDKIDVIVSPSKIILDEDFLISIFDQFRNELPPFNVFFVAHSGWYKWLWLRTTWKYFIC